MLRDLKIDIFRNAQPLLLDSVLQYDGEAKAKDNIDFLLLIRTFLTDRIAHIQVFVADTKPECEVNWFPLAVQSGSAMSRETLDILTTKYVAVNVVYRDGYDYAKNIHFK